MIVTYKDGVVLLITEGCLLGEMILKSIHNIILNEDLTMCIFLPRQLSCLLPCRGFLTRSDINQTVLLQNNVRSYMYLDNGILRHHLFFYMALVLLTV